MLAQALQAARYARTHPAYLMRMLRFRFIEKHWAKRGERGRFLARVLLMLTGDCNLDCEMCNAPRANTNLLDTAVRRWRTEQLKLSDYAKLFKDLRSLKTDIVLTGGESLIHREWVSIAQLAKEEGLKVDLQTNGMLIDRYLEAIVENIDVLNLSIDGPESVHDKIRGRSGAFQKVMQNLKLVEEEKRRRRSALPIIQIVPTVTESNYRCLAAMVNEVTSYLPKVFIGIQHLLYATSFSLARYERELDGKGTNRELIFWQPSVGSPSIEGKVVLSEMKKIQQIGAAYVSFIPELSDAEVIQWYASPESLPRRFIRGCISPWYDLDVCPDGDVRICIDASLGNIKEQSILEIFQSAKTQELRKSILSEGPFSICRACCNLYKYTF